MKKGILGILFVIFIYCAFHLLAFHETLVQIEHSEPLQVSCQNALNINTEKTENGFITDIVLPSGIIYRQAQLEIKSDVQQNAVIKLAGPRVAYKDTYKKYTIDYKIVIVNGEIVQLSDITASFLKPLSYSIDNLSMAKVLFSHKTNFVLRNMSIAYLSSMIVTLLVILGYSAFIMYHSMAARTVVFNWYNIVTSKELLLLIVAKYKNIRKEYKICFWVNFLTLNIVYLYLNMNFLHGNHDWLFMNHNEVIDHIWVGRYSILFINFLTGHKYLPLLNNFFTFAFLSLIPIVLVRYWNLAATKFNIFAISVVLLLHPSLLSILYFHFLSYTYVLAPLLLVIGLILSEKHNCLAAISSVCLLVFAFGDYNVCINTLAVIFLGKILLEYANGNSFITLLKKYLRTICILLVSCIIYYLIFQCLKYANIVVEDYNTKLLAFNQILPRVITVFIDSFRHFYFTYSFIDFTYCIFLTLLFVPMIMIALIETIKKKNILYFAGLLFIFVLLVFASKIVYCFSVTYVLFVDYLYYFSLPFVYVVIIAYILNSRLIWSKNLLFILLVPIFYLSVLHDFEYQKFWKNGLEGDKNIISHLGDRIEEQDEFLFNKEYKLVFIGNYKTFNSYYSLSLMKSQKPDYSDQIIAVPFFPPWSIIYIKYYVPQLNLKSGMIVNSNSSREKLENTFIDIPYEKIRNLKPWLHKNSVLVYKNTIVVCWQEKELEYVQKALMESD